MGATVLRLVQSTCTAAAYFYSPYVSLQVSSLILLATLVCGMIALVLTHRFVRSVEADKSRAIECAEEWRAEDETG